MSETAYTSVVRKDDAVTIVGGGTLDLTNYQEFHEAIKNASRTEDDLTIDIRTADFIDTAVVQDLAKAALTLLKRGKRLKVLASDERYPIRVLKISGFQAIMDMESESGAL